MWVLILAVVIVAPSGESEGSMLRAGPFDTQTQCVAAYGQIMDTGLTSRDKYTSIEAHCRDDVTGRTIHLKRLQ